MFAGAIATAITQTLRVTAALNAIKREMQQSLDEKHRENRADHRALTSKVEDVDRRVARIEGQLQIGPRGVN